MSISTRIPTGPIHRADFCYAPLYELLRYSNGTQQNYIDPDSTEFFSCASAKTPKKGPVELKDSDFQAFCCDGHVIGWTETDPPDGGGACGRWEYRDGDLGEGDSVLRLDRYGAWSEYDECGSAEGGGDNAATTRDDGNISSSDRKF
ncbi:hypothetical protein GRF29_19g2552303 [Pseudopithomyces chartarum]|uniref:Uncharacterized protein n=1 Tax=Pseudopithomyces chartarum TaxID=1892770 RepID=A0AAN6RLA6_9PLEO|nr:hypothetical protein GRF29_19g2552303 [Pseudopithomyces chartarum]